MCEKSRFYRGSEMDIPQAIVLDFFLEHKKVCTNGPCFIGSMRWMTLIALQDSLFKFEKDDTKHSWVTSNNCVTSMIDHLFTTHDLQ